MKKWMIISFILILIGILFSAGLILILTLNPDKPKSIPDNWKTYSYEDDGIKRYEFMHPSESKITELGDYGLFKTEIKLLFSQEPYLDKSLYLFIDNTSKDRCILRWGHSGTADIERKETVINGVKFEKETWEEKNAAFNYYYENYKTYSNTSYFCYNFMFLIKTKEGEKLSDSEALKESEIFSKIISTFKPFRL